MSSRCLTQLGHHASQHDGRIWLCKRHEWCADTPRSEAGSEDEVLPDWGRDESGKPPLKLGKVLSCWSLLVALFN